MVHSDLLTNPLIVPGEGARGGVGRGALGGAQGPLPRTTQHAETNTHTARHALPHMPHRGHAAPPSPLARAVKILRGHEVVDYSGVLDVAFHPTQPWLFTAGADATICLFVNP